MANFFEISLNMIVEVRVLAWFIAMNDLVLIEFSATQTVFALRNPSHRQPFLFYFE